MSMGSLIMSEFVQQLFANGYTVAEIIQLLISLIYIGVFAVFLYYINLIHKKSKKIENNIQYIITRLNEIYKHGLTLSSAQEPSVQEMLRNLDKRLAEGWISEEIYKELKRKLEKNEND